MLLRTTGNAGQVTVSAGTLSIANIGQISSDTFGPGKGGSVFVNAGTLSIAGNSFISSDTFGPGKAGNVAVMSLKFTRVLCRSISSSTFAAGDAGSVTLTISDRLTIDSLGGIFSTARSEERRVGKECRVRGGTLSIVNSGEILRDTFGPENAGSVAGSVTGQLTS